MVQCMLGTQGYRCDMIDKIKKDILNYGKDVLIIKINNIRNKSEVVEGVISEAYDRLFIVKCFDGINRSFSYSDVLISNIEIQRKMC